MARGWTCPRCSTENGEGTMNCSKCGLIKGGVFVPSAYTPPETAGSPAVTPPPPPGAASGPGDATGGVPVSSWNVGAAAAPGPVPFWRRLPIGLLIFGLLIVGGVVAGVVFNAGRSDSGEINRAGDMVANDLRVGDCFDLKEPEADEVSDVTARPCAEAHEYEVFHIASMPDGDYPLDAAITDFVETSCLPVFETYVGLGYRDSVLDFSWLYPNSDAWSSGDRTVQCVAYDPGNKRLTEPLKGSAR